jgi:methylated-DNA-[protein]-cysteine S-methyltransferase
LYEVLIDVHGKSMKDNVVASITFDSPIGRMRLQATDRGISSVQSAGRAERASDQGATSILRRAKREFLEYLDGCRRRFTVEVDLSVGTDFQQRVWKEIAKVPYGKVITYGELAARAGCPGGARAAGQATGSNPVGIIIPCHRIVAAGGRMGGFGGGLPLKRRLLTLEGIVLERD